MEGEVVDSEKEGIFPGKWGKGLDFDFFLSVLKLNHRKSRRGGQSYLKSNDDEALNDVSP